MLAALLDGVDMLHAARHLAPHGILPVEPGRIAEADEELAVGAVGILRARHRAGAAHVLLARELRFEIRQLRAARTRAGRIAGLRHEARNDAVEDDAVVKALRGKRLDAFDVLRREIWPQRNRHRPRLQFHYQGFLCHYLPFNSLQRLTRSSATWGLV